MSLFEYYAHRLVGSFPEWLKTSELITVLWGPIDEEWKINVIRTLEEANLTTVGHIRKAANENHEALDRIGRITKCLLIEKIGSSTGKAKTY